MPKEKEKEKRKGKNDGPEKSMKLLVKRYTFSVVLLCMLGTVHGIMAAEPDPAGKTDLTEEGQEMREVDKFQYQFENRPDPFLPFLSKKPATNLIDNSPVEEKGKPLTGMQLFEPGDLRLVALLKVNSENVAMVEDSRGKGYRLNEKMLIGRYGTINRITNEQVEITEQYTTKTGRVVTKEIIMRLKKDGK